MKQKLESDNINSEQNNPNSGENIPSHRESTSAEHFFRNIDLTVEKPLQASPIRSSLSDKMILKSSLKKSALNPKIPAGVKIPCKWTSSKITDYSNLIESNSIVSENMMDAKSSKKNKPTKFVGFKSPLKTNPVSKKQFSKDPTSYSYYEYRPNTFKTLYSERAARRLGIRRSPYRPSPNLSNRTRRNDRRLSDMSHSKKDVERSFSRNRHALDNRSIRDNAIDRCEGKSSRNLTSNEVSIDKNAEKFKTSNKNFDQHSYLSNLPNSKNNEHDKHLRSCSISSDKLNKTETSIPNLKTLNKRQESSSNIFSNVSEITTSKKAILSKNKFEPKKSDKAIKTNKLSSDNSELLSEIKDSNEVEEIPIRSLAEQEELEKAVASLTNTEYLYPQNPVVPSKETPVKPFLDYSAIQDQISEAAKIIALGAGSLSGDTSVADQLQKSMENILKLIKEKP
ncbi:uncharacterized protein CEXT_454631 [Caerostris extrusa]|uniref:Uncharacterized protein n=1 Tax=Caerostris extrusa TaxID=172846 RepID=A0AAV4N5S4_CAEEX|nr:uncharacterized protein CEXT_454631 [Caerostris extrusa]